MFLKPRYLNQAIIRFFCNIFEPLYGNDEYQKEHELSDEFFKSEPSDYVVGFLKEILIKIKELKNAVSQSHVVIYGSSICIIYETIDIAKEVEKRCNNNHKKKMSLKDFLDENYFHLENAAASILVTMMLRIHHPAFQMTASWLRMLV